MLCLTTCPNAFPLDDLGTYISIHPRVQYFTHQHRYQLTMARLARTIHALQWNKCDYRLGFDASFGVHACCAECQIPARQSRTQLHETRLMVHARTAAVVTFIAGNARLYYVNNRHRLGDGTDVTKCSIIGHGAKNKKHLRT